MSPHARLLAKRHSEREARIRAARIRYGNRRGVEAFRRWLAANRIISERFP